MRPEFCGSRNERVNDATYGTSLMHEAIGTSTDSLFGVMRPVAGSIWKTTTLLTGNTRTRILTP
ncbi:MAG: hypothetical protein Q8M07_09875 [Prosthecobacter sp.]|nr:hypothetical protein [Prosthecobacter sp.]